MNVFTEIPDALAVLHCKGVYSQASLFNRGKFVYAKRGSGFVRLYRNGATSVPSVSWKDIDLSAADLLQDQFYLIYAPHQHKIAGTKPVQIAAE